MGHSEHDPAAKERRPGNAGRLIGAKRALKPQQVWVIRFWLDREGRPRDRAMFDLAIDSKLRGCDVVKIKSAGSPAAIAFALAQLLFSKRRGGPFNSSCLRRPAAACSHGSNTG